MNAETFIESLENGTLPPDRFGHRGHVYAAWACFQRDAPEVAMRRYCRALQGYAAHLGVPEKYHETITRALLILIHDRLQACPEGDWDRFQRDQSDLIERAPDLLARHYSPERLNSEAARSRFVAPDRAALPGPMRGAA